LLSIFISTALPAFGQVKTKRFDDPFFNVERILGQFKGVREVTISGKDGRDLGAKINEADRILGKGKAIINLIDGGFFYTPAYTSRDRMITLDTGLYKSRTVGNYGRVFLVNNMTVIYGKSKDAIIEEADDPPIESGEPPNHSLIAPFTEKTIAVNPNIGKFSNLHIIGVTFQGARVNYSKDIGLATVSLGNGDDSSVQDSIFRDMSGYAIQVGGTATNFITGEVYTARHNAVLRNKIYNNLIQNLAFINVDGLVVKGNEIYNPNKRPFAVKSISSNGLITTTEDNSIYTGIGIRIRKVEGITNLNDQTFTARKLSPSSFTIFDSNGIQVVPQGIYLSNGYIDLLYSFATLLDVEPNGDRNETVRNLKIIENLFDADEFYGAYFGAIAFQITKPTIKNSGNEISDNVIKGVRRGVGQMSFGIVVYGKANDLIVNRNTVNDCGQHGLILTGKYIKADYNVMTNCGGGGNSSGWFFDLSKSRIRFNKFTDTQPARSFSNELIESGTNQFNYFEGNEASVISHGQGGVITDTTYKNNVTDFGIIQNQNSKKNYFTGNVIRGATPTPSPTPNTTPTPPPPHITPSPTPTPKSLQLRL